jgi:hypothetical protein
MNREMGLAKSRTAMRRAEVKLAIGAVALLARSVIHCCLPDRCLVFAQTHADLAAIIVDYPEDGSVFPPEITPPTFIWHDESKAASSWAIDMSFSDGSPVMRFQSAGERIPIGEIDPRCVSPSNEPPALTPRQATAHT